VPTAPAAAPWAMRRSILRLLPLARLRSLDQVAIARGVKTPDGRENPLDIAGAARVADEQLSGSGFSWPDLGARQFVAPLG